LSAVDVSICALTYRRPEGLTRLRESLERMKLPSDVRVEWIIVDNDPEASAFAGAGRATVAGSIPVVWQHEPSGDTSRARNRAVETARGEWIAWIDDDETASEAWLACYLMMLEHFEADGFFGPVIPRLEAPCSEGPDLGRFYARPRGATGSPATLPRTSNGFVRRVLHREHPFDLDFGSTFGEDAECFLRAQDRGARFVWCDEASVVEWIPAERHRARYLARRAVQGASAWSRIEQRRGGRSRLLRGVIGVLRLGLAGVVLPFRACAGRNERLAGWLRLCGEWGRLAGLLGSRPNRGELG
jgi:succinoglycan biosynthesis protein ExoM